MMELDLDQPFALSPTVQDTEADGDLVLLDLQREQFFGLNEAGAHLWRGLGEGLTPRQVIAELAETYDAPEERLRADVLATMEQFTARGWVTPRPSPAAGG